MLVGYASFTIYGFIAMKPYILECRLFIYNIHIQFR